MKWQDFKESVEKQLKDMGIPIHLAEIEYIDTSWTDEVIVEKSSRQNPNLISIS